MSYILDALRKSETERRQGKVPDLGQQLHLVHRPKRRRRVGAAGWLALALMANAGVLAYIFWPATSRAPETPVPAEAVEPGIPAPMPAQPVADAPPELVTPPAPTVPELAERATIIVPSARPGGDEAPVAATGIEIEERVPHLVELPLSFQKSIPDLTFNSHIFSSDPQARRVMINGHYLRTGEGFAGLRVERITEDGVVLSKDGQRFRVGVVRDWVSPR